MSFFYSYARFAFCVLLCVMHAMLVILIALPFAVDAGGSVEIVSLVFSSLAMLLTMVQFVVLVISGGAEIFPSIVFAGTTFLSSLFVAIIMTTQLHDSRLQSDYVGLGSGASAGSIVVPFAWCTATVALAAFAVVLLYSIPDVHQVTSFGTHRVVWRTDNIPMNSLASPQKPHSFSYTQRERKWLQPPTPAHISWTERHPEQLRTTYNQWPSHEEV